MLWGDSTETEKRHLYCPLTPEGNENSSKAPASYRSQCEPAICFPFGLLAKTSEERPPPQCQLKWGDVLYTQQLSPETTWHQHATLISKGRPLAKLEEPGNKELWSQGLMSVAPLPVAQAQCLGSLAERCGQSLACQALCPCEIYQKWGGGRGSTACG